LNTIPSLVVDIHRRSVPIKGGLSGPVLKPIALKAVYELSSTLPVPVLGSGGIMNCADALSFLMAGACAVQIGTATFIDPYTIPKIIQGLKKYLTENKCPCIGDLMGVAHE